MGTAAPPVARSLEFEPYYPLFGHPDLATIVGRYWPVRLEPGEPRLFPTEPGVQVLGRCHWRDPRAPVAVLVHGLEGSCDSTYVRWMARATLDAGFDVVRLNVRNCGGTEHLAPTLYHSGLTTDLRAVVAQLAPRRLFLIGFSMGGNQVLKLAGEWGVSAPPHVAAVCAISAPIDLAACARRLGEPRNRVYERHFLRRLAASLRRKVRLFPDRFSLAPLARVRCIIDFDHHITAPAFGFRDAWDYYEQSSALRYLDAVRLPALLIQARDDPFIPFACYRLPVNAALRLLAPDHGGHVSFLSRTPPRFWAARQALRFFQAYA
ncbi:MAG TPA: alpha/beta fold hydrolase [Bryobacterales bacterium]|nr:alpha/beta fold hydrolase [Bryobacterales bacterium]